MKQRPAPRPAPAPEPPIALTVSEDLALAIAHGCAASTFDTVATRAARDSDRLPRGQFWAVGRECATPELVALTKGLAAFVLRAPDAPAEALYIHVTRELAPRDCGPFAEAPLAERLAYAAFVRVLPPLVAEARLEARRREDVRAAAVAAPPDAEMFQRIGRPPKPVGAQIRMSASVKSEAAE